MGIEVTYKRYMLHQGGSCYTALTITLLTIVILCSNAQTSGPRSFVAGNNNYVLYLQPATFLEAVTSCANRQFPGGATGSLLPVADLATLLARLSLTNQDLLQELVAGVLAAQQAGQESWDLWVADQYRTCRAVDVQGSTAADYVLVSTDVPCSWKLSFICVSEGSIPVVPSASSWYRSLQALAASQPSPYRQGPGASGLTLISSGRVAGPAAVPTNLTVAFNDSSLFWEYGPITTFVFRTKGLMLQPVRQNEPTDPWAMAANLNTAANATASPLWQTYNVGRSYNDYITSVQGCYDNTGITALLFATRTARAYQVAFGGCTGTYFWEDAPTGGYLAGLAGVAVDPTLAMFQPSIGEWQYIQGVDTQFPLNPWLKQIRPIWAVPAGSSAPSYGGRQPAAAPTTPSCPTARPVATSAAATSGLATEEACGPATGAVCPSDTCCSNATISSGSGGGVNASTLLQAAGFCRAEAAACTIGCDEGWGLCGTAPGVPTRVFLRSTPDSAATELFASYTGAAAMSYPEAVLYCSSSRFLGLRWTHGSLMDLVAFEASPETRPEADADFKRLKFWVSPDPLYVNATSDQRACLRATVAQPYGRHVAPLVVYPSPCSANATAFCKAHSTAGSGGTGGGGGSSGSGSGGGSSVSGSAPSKASSPPVQRQADVLLLEPAASTYNLTLSQPLGAGPYGTRPCAFTCATTPLQPPPVTVNIPRTEHISSISVSYASSVSGVPVPAAVCGIKVELWDGNDSPTQSGSEQVAGAASSEGWLTLQLGPGEAVTGVGGCAGGFLERLVLHTDSGRAWTAPWTGQSPCSTPFHVQAPPGGKLVGVQGYMGSSFIEQLWLVWGVPTNATAPPPLDDPEDPTAARSRGGNGVNVGAAVGGAVGGAVGLVVLLALGVVLYRRRSKGGAAAAWHGAGGGWGGKASSPGGAAEVVLTVLATDRATGSSQAVTPCSDNSSGLDEGNDGCFALPSRAYLLPADVESGLSVYRSKVEARNASLIAPRAAAALRPVRSGDADSAVAAQGGAIVEDDGERPGGGAGGEDRNGGGDWGGVRSNNADCGGGGGGGGKAMGGSEGSSDTGTPGGCREVAAAVNLMQADLGRGYDANPQLRVHNVLGRGSYGIVYLGTWRGLTVAVKVLLVNDAAAGREAQRRHRALLEAALASSLHHPNVVGSYSYHVQQLAVVGQQGQLGQQAQDAHLEGADGGQRHAAVEAECKQAADANPAAAAADVLPASAAVYKLYIIQEYCDMGSLKDALRSGVVGSVLGGGASSLCALSLALDVACGMAHIHAKHIVHGDLSAGNVLLASGPPALASVPCSPADALVARSLAGCWRPPVVAKVADFGLSVALGEGQTHASRRFQGTPAYTAPEVLARGHLSKAADVYSYGVLLLELTYGTLVPLMRLPKGPAAAAAAPDLASTPGRPPSLSRAATRSVSLRLSSGCPVELSRLIVACTDQDARQRPTFTKVVTTLVELLVERHAVVSRGTYGHQQERENL